MAWIVDSSLCPGMQVSSRISDGYVARKASFSFSTSSAFKRGGSCSIQSPEAEAGVARAGRAEGSASASYQSRRSVPAAGENDQSAEVRPNGAASAESRKDSKKRSRTSLSGKAWEKILAVV